MLLNEKIIPVPGIQIGINMLDDYGIFISIETDDDPEVHSIFLPSDDAIKFSEIIERCAKFIKDGR